MTPKCKYQIKRAYPYAFFTIKSGSKNVGKMITKNYFTYLDDFVLMCSYPLSQDTSLIIYLMTQRLN
jgi:hypothetical protein